MHRLGLHESSYPESNSTAILFFSRTAIEEAELKTFHLKAGLKKNTAISKCLIKKTIKTLQHTELPIFHFSTTEQTGKDFGERLANSVEIVYQSGFEKVIVVGNDCPSITYKLIGEVKEALQFKKLVLGPAKDGGLYLIGMHKSCYSRKQFISLDWQEKELQLSWQQYANQYTLQIQWLTTFTDIDNASDFQKFLQTLSNLDLLKIQLLRIIATQLRALISVYKGLFNQFSYQQIPSRAPPVII